MWQQDTADDYRDLLTKIGAAATSKHVSAVVINSGGSGYVVGDILTLPQTDISYLEASVEVLAVSSGVITSVALRNMGAYAMRAVSATVGSGGSGYSVGDILQVDGGTWNERAKFQVSSVSSGAVTAVTLFETGGSYTAAPSNPAATTLVGPSTGTGTGCTLNLTMSSSPSTTGVAGVGGSGSSATFDLTFTDPYCTSERNSNNYSFNGLTDEKEVVLEFQLSGWDHPFLGFRTFTTTVSTATRWNLLCVGMTAHNPATSFESQANIGPTNGTPSNTDGANIGCLNTSMSFWLSVSDRRIFLSYKAVGASTTAYENAYLGFGNPLGTQVENPWPMYILACIPDQRVAPDAATDGVSSLPEAYRLTTTGFPTWFRRQRDGVWTEIGNRTATTQVRGENITPTGEMALIASQTQPGTIVTDSAATFLNGGIVSGSGATATKLLYPTPDSVNGDQHVFFPLTHARGTSTTENDVDVDVGSELDGLYWISATKDDGSSIAAEDYVDRAEGRYRVFPAAHRRTRYSFMVVAEA